MARQIIAEELRGKGPEQKAMREITCRRMGTWADVKGFLAQYPKVKVIEEGYPRSIQDSRKMLAVIQEMESEKAVIQDAWKPWYVGDCGDQTAVSLSDTFARTRWLLPA